MPADPITDREMLAQIEGRMNAGANALGRDGRDSDGNDVSETFVKTKDLRRLLALAKRGLDLPGSDAASTSPKGTP